MCKTNIQSYCFVFIQKNTNFTFRIINYRLYIRHIMYGQIFVYYFIIITQISLYFLFLFFQLPSKSSANSPPVLFQLPLFLMCFFLINLFFTTKIVQYFIFLINLFAFLEIMFIFIIKNCLLLLKVCLFHFL